MPPSDPIPSNERIVDAMMQLARAARLHRMIVAGPGSAAIAMELHRQGYPRVTTDKLCRAPYGQFDVALAAWRDQSGPGVETTLDELVRFTHAAGVLVVWVAAHLHISTRVLRLRLERRGFRIEAGTLCEDGVAFSARPLATGATAKIA